MVVENPTWRAPRIHGELLMLSFDVSERTISGWMKRAPRDPESATRWLTFSVITAKRLPRWASHVPTITFSALYCFFRDRDSRTDDDSSGAGEGGMFERSLAKIEKRDAAKNERPKSGKWTPVRLPLNCSLIGWFVREATAMAE